MEQISAVWVFLDEISWWDQCEKHNCTVFQFDGSGLHALYLTYIHIHTKHPPLFLTSFWNRSLFTSDERGGGGRKMAKRDREMREKGESWPLGLNEASSVSEGAGGWTKWLIHFPRDPLPPSLRSQKNIHRHMRTLSLVDGSSDPVAGFYRDGNMASVDPEGAQ